MPVRKRRNDEPDINPGGASSLTADTPKWGASEQGSSAENENLLAGCIAAVNKLLCDTPSVDFTQDRTPLSGKFPEDQLKASRELEMRNILYFHTFELVDEMPQGKHASDMVWVGEWRGDRVRSRLCVRQFKAEGLRDDLFAEHQTRSSSSICWPKLRVARISDYSLSTSVLQLCTLKQMREFM